MNTYPTEAVKEALIAHSLETHDPFGEFLAKRIGDRPLAAIGFKLAIALALYDAKKGIDAGSLGAPLGSVHGYPPQMYSVVQTVTEYIVKTVLGSVFAAEFDA